MIEIDEEKYDKLPFRESRYQNITRRYGSMYNCTKFEYRDYPHYRIIRRFLSGNIGNEFDDVFSKFCKKYSANRWYDIQRMFLEEVNEVRGYRWYKDSFYLDDNGLIQRYPRRKRKIRIIARTWDYQAKAVDKSHYSKKTGTYVYKYETQIIAGAEYEFSSRNYRYKRFVEDNRKKREQVQKKLKKQKKEEWEYLIQFNTKETERKEKEESMRKLISHGFDPVTSFRNH